MGERNTVAHALHDIGLAAWFGGSLMGAIGVNGAAADVDDPRQRARVANAGWGRWSHLSRASPPAYLLVCCSAQDGATARTIPAQHDAPPSRKRAGRRRRSATRCPAPCAWRRRRRHRQQRRRGPAAR